MAQGHVGGRALQQMGGHGGEPRLQRGAGARHRAARHRDRTRRVGAGGVRRHRGVAMHHRDRVDGNAQHLVGDLRQRRLHALAMGMHADADLEPAVGRETDGGLLVAGRERIARGAEQRGPVRGHLDVIGEADADEGVAAVPLVPLPLPRTDRGKADRLTCGVEAAAIIAAVVGVAGHADIGHSAAGHEIVAPHVAGLAPHRARDGIDGQLHGEADAGARNAAIRNDRRLVGCDREGADTVGRKRIGAGQMPAGHGALETGGERPGRIGARVDGDLGIEPQELAALIGISRDNVVMLATIGAGNQMLAAILDPAERPPEFQREPGDAELLGLQHALVAETAADIRRDDADAALRDAEVLGERGADHVRHLRRGIDHELAGPLLPVRQRGLAFDGVHGLPRHTIFAAHHDRRGRGHRGDALVERGLQEQVVLPRLMHERRRRFARRPRIDLGRQHVEVELGPAREVLGVGTGRGHAHRHRLADEAHLAMGKWRIVGRLETGQAEPSLH